MSSPAVLMWFQRKQARQRRDYLYRRALTLRDAEIAEKRAKLKASLASGKPLAPDVANDKELRTDFRFDESQVDRTTEERLDLDDEYAELSGVVVCWIEPTAKLVCLCANILFTGSSGFSYNVKVG